jgi:hypothetical protein
VIAARELHFTKGTHITAREKTLHIDIPVKLTEVKVVFSVAPLSKMMVRTRSCSRRREIAGGSDDVIAVIAISFFEVAEH